MQIPRHGIEDQYVRHTWSYLVGCWIIYGGCAAFCITFWAAAGYGLYRWISG